MPTWDHLGRLLIMGVNLSQTQVPFAFLLPGMATSIKFGDPPQADLIITYFKHTENC